jgi:hypothetical protein
MIIELGKVSQETKGNIGGSGENFTSMTQHQ